MNLDQYHPQGKPSKSELEGFSIVRLPIRWKKYQGETVETALAKQRDYINNLIQWDKKVILIITHEWGLEGQGYNWVAMNDSLWERMTDEYVQNLSPIISAFGDKVIYQIHNENDGVDTGSSVIIPAHIYGNLFKRSYTLIKSRQPRATVITSGFKSGPENAWTYFKNTGIQSNQVDAIAIHEYGRGGNDSPLFKPFGSIEYSLSYWRSKTNIPIMITEWGVLDQRPPESQVVAYAIAFLNAVRTYPQVIEQCWFAYGEQHNAYGVIGKSQLKQALVNGWKTSTPEPEPDEKPTGLEWVEYRLDGNMNYREQPSLSGHKIGLLRTNDIVWVNEKSFNYASGYAWKQCWHPTYKYGWVAIVSGVGRTPA